MSRAGIARLVLLLLALASLSWLAFRPRGGAGPADVAGPYPGGTVTARARDGAAQVIDARAPVMGTRFLVEVSAPDEAAGRAACRAAYARIHDLEAALSTWIPDSELSRVNREAAERAVPVSADTLRLLGLAGTWHRLSGGVFDPSVGPLLRLWKPLAKMERLPPDAEVDAARALVGFDRIRVDSAAGTVSFPVEGMSIDLGGIAKGFAAGEAAKAALAAGATACRVNAGGDVAALGAPPWDPDGFRVQVRDPGGDDDAALPGREFALRDGAVATSGNYERYTEVDGVRYSHILDPRTGRPVADAVVQVTVVGRTGAQTDALATALTVLGVDEGSALAARAGVEALFLVRDGDRLAEVATPGFPEKDR